MVYIHLIFKTIYTWHYLQYIDHVVMSDGSRPPHKNNEFGVLSGLLGGQSQKRKRSQEGRAPLQSHRVTIEQTIAQQQDDWKPIPLRPPKRRKCDCFGCEYGMTNPDETQPALKGLWRMFSENFGKEMTNENLAAMMHEYFEQEIRQPMLSQGHECPEWPVEMVLEHIEVHILEPTVNTANQIRNMKFVENLLFKQIRLENTANKETKVDLKTLKAVIDVQKQIQALYNAKCTRQLGYSDLFKLDDRRSNQSKD